MENAALNALYARAEIFNRFEELGSQLNPEEAEIASHYLENLIKTRPVRAQLCPESEQVSETNCEFCAAGVPRYKTHSGEWCHEVDTREVSVFEKCGYKTVSGDMLDAQN